MRAMRVDHGLRRGSAIGLLAASMVVAVLVVLVAPAGAQDVRAGVEQLASQIAKGAPPGRQLRVAVVDFPDLQGVTSELGRFIASRLTTRLAQGQGFFVIERQRLGQVLTELRFSMSDLVDPTKAKQLGKMVGVEALVVGAIADLGNQIDVDARIIEIDSTRMIFGTSVTIAKDPSVVAMLERGRQEPSAATLPGSPPPTPGVGSPVSGSGTGKAVVIDGMRFEPRDCRRLASPQPHGKIFCVVAIMNTGDKDRKLLVSGNAQPPSRLIDSSGLQHRVRVVVANGVGDDGLWVVFPPGIPTGVQLFARDEIDPATTHLSVVVGISGFSTSAVLRDLPVRR